MGLVLFMEASLQVVKTTQPVHEQLAHRAWEILCTNLMRYGNTLSEPHRVSLDYLMRGLAELAFGIKRGRLAYPLGCGPGKTQAIVAFCTGFETARGCKVDEVLLAAFSHYLVGRGHNTTKDQKAALL